MRTKEQQQEYSAKWYQKNREKHLLQTKLRRDKVRRELQVIKSERGCERCGWNEHPAGLDFHHPEESKEFTISQSMQKPRQSLLDEAAKCDVLCSNCHRVHHALEMARSSTVG